MNTNGNNSKSVKSTEVQPEVKDDENVIKTRFDEYAGFEDRESNGSIALPNILMWLKQAELLEENNGISEAQTVKAFEKATKGKRRMNYDEFEDYVATIAEIMKMNRKELTNKLISTADPVISCLAPPMRSAHHLEIHKNKDKEWLDLDCNMKYVSVFKILKKEEDKN